MATRALSDRVSCSGEASAELSEGTLGEGEGSIPEAPLHATGRQLLGANFNHLVTKASGKLSLIAHMMKEEANEVAKAKKQSKKAAKKAKAKARVHVPTGKGFCVLAEGSTVPHSMPAR